MRKPGGRFLILVVAGLLSAAGLARSEEAAVEVGAAVCAGCHAEHAEAFKKSWHGRKMPAMKDVPFEKSCESCHGPGSLHAAAAGDKSHPGFATTRITEAANGRCLSCHKQRSLMNWKVSTHHQQNLACAKCHKTHEGEGAPKPKSEVCISCHRKQAAESNLPFHHPIAEGKMECSDCHNPHGGDFRNLRAESVNETCFKCHSDKSGPYQFEHPPVTENCQNCHNPHGSINDKLLKQSEPFLCMACHKNRHMNSLTNIQQRSRCTTCHFAIHGSDHRSTFRH